MQEKETLTTGKLDILLIFFRTLSTAQTNLHEPHSSHDEKHVAEKIHGSLHIFRHVGFVVCLELMQREMGVSHAIKQPAGTGKKRRMTCS